MSGRANHFLNMIKTARILTLTLAAFALPATAQEQPAPNQSPRWDDYEAMERSAREALEKLQKQLGPYLEQFRAELGDALEALDAYEAPRILPNGDILIPRKRPLPDTPPEESPETADPSETIDL